MINKTYRIFLASSSKLKKERDEIEKEIFSLNDEFNQRRTYLELVIWEKLDSAVSQTRKQDDYIRELKSCDILLLVYWGELGKFTYEEYKTAYELFLSSGGQTPRIYIHKKNVTANWNLEADNEENLRILEDALKQQDKEQWPRLFENKDALTKNIKETIEKLFNHSSYDHFTYGDQVPYNETFGNEGFVIRDHSLLKARNMLTKKPRVLYVHGISGSGKTKFVDNLLYDIARPGNTMWIDCAESNPTPIEIAAKLRQVVDFAHISPERKTLIQQKLAPDNRDDIDKLNNEVLSDLSNQLQSVTLDDLLDWFPKESYQNRPVYLVLDDYDNLISEDGGTHWLAGNFVEKCLQHDYAPCIIIIFKYPENEGSDKTRRYLQHTNDIIKANAPLKVNEIELRYLSDDEEDEFYAERNTNITQKAWLSEVRALKGSWMPVQLQLLADLFKKRVTEADFNEIKQIVVHNKDKDTDLINQLCRFLFDQISKEANGDDLILVAFAASILQKYNAGHRAIDKSALQFMLTDRYSSVEAINAELLNLRTLNVLKTFYDNQPTNTQYKEYSFQHDTKLNYCFSELPASGLSQNVNADKKEFFHHRAADFYSTAFENENDEFLKVRYGEFAVWNYSQLVKSKGKRDRLLKALPILNKIDRELRTSFNYKGLNELRRGVVPDLNAIFSGEERTTYFVTDNYLEEQASNLADLAEIYFQGLDQWDEAKNITLDVYKKLKNNVFTKGTNNAIDAFLQAAHLAAILSFETFLEQKEFENHFNTEQEYSDIPDKYKLWCIRFTEIILRKYLHIPVTEIYDGKRKYPCDDLHDRAIIANLACSLGVFLNRSEKYEHAIKIYQFAVSIIETLINDVDAAVNKKVNQCDRNLSEAVLPEEKAHWEGQKAYWVNRGEGWREYIDKDLMCIHSNLSRTILLMTGVDEAIAYFNNNLSAWFGNQPKRINPHHSYSSGQEYNYAVLNICYYHFCKGEVSEAKKWLNKSQDIPGEEWLKATNEQMRLVLRSYDPGVMDKEEVMRNFKDNCVLFRDRIGDSRAVLFSEFNRTALNIALQLEDAGQYAPDTDELVEIFDNLLDFRKRADEKEYFLASKVITYTHNHFLKLLQEGWKTENERGFLKPHSKWKNNWESEVLNHLNGIMTCNSPDVSFSPWRPPMLMAGILLMRSKPFSPSDNELEEFRALKIKDYNP